MRRTTSGAELHELFEADDGSLPEVVFTDLPRSALQPLFALLMERGTVNADRGGTLWDPALQADVPVSDVPDAGQRVASGQLPSFHVVFTNIEIDGTKLPPLGAFFVKDELALDYRMGDEWNPTALAAFARLLDAMRTLAPGSSLHTRPDDGGSEHADPRFESALDRYLSQSHEHEAAGLHLHHLAGDIGELEIVSPPPRIEISTAL